MLFHLLCALCPPARETRAALPLGRGIHTVRKESKHLDLFSGKLPCREVWCFNGPFALIWREVIFLSALLIRWELVYN